MTEPIPLFVELCAGTAAVSLRLHRDGAKPPVSRMGSKSGYSDCLLRVLGLIPGQRADRYLWCEPDPGVRLLLHAYRDAGLARAAAAIIRSWAAEDPRALWERLRAEGPPRLPDGPVDAGEVARWAFVVSRAVPQAWARGITDGDFIGSREETPDGSAGRAISRETLACNIAGTADVPATITPDARHIDPREVARWAQITASNRLINTAWSDTEGRWVNTGDGGATFGGDAFCSPPTRTAEGMEAAPGDVPAVVVPDAREVDPREVARAIAVMASTMDGTGRGRFTGWFRPATGAALVRNGPGYNAKLVELHGLDQLGRVQSPGGGHPDVMCPRLDALPAIHSALIHPDARDIDPPALPPGTVAYMDPSYVGTTGYADNLGRAEVVALARRWAAAGATVAISEAEPIPELVAEGWHAVEITGERVGQKRVFSKQQVEWVTLNRPPAWTPPVQGRLF
jgi:hypothetical protein